VLCFIDSHSRERLITYFLSAGRVWDLNTICCLLPSESSTQTAEVSEWPALPWPGSLSSPSCCCGSVTQLPSSCPTPMSSGSCWAATRRQRTRTAAATQLEIGPDVPSAGRTARRSSSYTTSWGAPFTPLPQTWSTWWDKSPHPDYLYCFYSERWFTFINCNLSLYHKNNFNLMCQQPLKWGCD